MKMFSNFRRVFKSSPEEKQQDKDWLNELEQKLLQDRESIRFVKKKDSILYVSEPFRSFLGDCTCCSCYQDGRSFVTGGYCKLHDINCGYGFVCRDNDSKWKLDIEY